MSILLSLLRHTGCESRNLEIHELVGNEEDAEVELKTIRKKNWSESIDPTMPTYERTSEKSTTSALLNTITFLET